MMRRTTIAADHDDLEILRAEARRGNQSLARYLGSMVGEKAAALRAGRRPRYGVGRSGTGRASVALESVVDEASPARGGPTG